MTTENLVRLIYASEATGTLTRGDITQILGAARRNNSHHGITGMLCHGNHRFLQYLEGRRSEVNAVYARIIADRRHKNLVLLDYSGITETRFDDWSMGFVDGEDPKIVSILARNAEQIEFRPEQMGSTDALLVTEQLKAHIDVQFSVDPEEPDEQEQTVVN